jgi:hypothetical protein
VGKKLRSEKWDVKEEDGEGKDDDGLASSGPSLTRPREILTVTVGEDGRFGCNLRSWDATITLMQILF